MQTYKDNYPDNTYFKVRVLGNTLAESKSTGDAYIVLKVEVVECTTKNPSEPIVLGGHRYINLYTSEKKLDETLAVIAEAEDFFGTNIQLSRLDASDPNHVSLEGFEFAAVSRHEEYNGKTQAKMQLAKNWSLKERGNGTVSTKWMDNMAPVSRAAKRGLDALKGAGRAFKASTQGVTDSDVPF